LVAHNQNPPKTHNISELLKQCAVIDKGFEQYSDKMAYLTEYAVEVRYPDDFYMPTIIEADGALVAAQQIRKFVRELLKIPN
jgi:HEPN domain-containing protein